MGKLFFYLIFIMVASACAKYDNKVLEGFPSGFLSDCPGSEKRSVISRKSLKFLSFTVMGAGNVFEARRARYNYFQMRQLAQDPGVDFKNRKTLVFVVGYMDSPNYFLSYPIAKLYNDLNYNVLVLDTSYFSSYAYPRASRYMRAAGKRGGEMLANLTKFGLQSNDIESIGISLGAQTMSFMAKSFQAITGRNISMLIGLDPAGPCFRHLGPTDRLDHSDADFVQMVATNIDGYGMAAPVGHVSFYVNGGEYQPGDVIWFPCDVVCSHFRSYTLWLAALLHPNSFVSMKCDSVQQARDKECYNNVPQITNIMGHKIDKKKHGIFYLATTNTFPYFLGKKGLKKENEISDVTMQNFNTKDYVEL